MKKGEEDDLEIRINRYLDGDVSDDEFEKYLAGRPENIDIEQIRALRSRVERIEDLYRQIKEPPVPDGYWDSFADRVTRRLPDAAGGTLRDRFLAAIQPWKWPVAAYGYIGAVVSVMLIVVIATGVQKGGKDIYSREPAESIVTNDSVEKPSLEPSGESTAGDLTQQAREAGTGVTIQSERLDKMRRKADDAAEIDKSAEVRLDEGSGKRMLKSETAPDKSRAGGVEPSLTQPEVSDMMDPDMRTGIREEPSPVENARDAGDIAVTRDISEIAEPTIRDKIVPQALSKTETAEPGKSGRAVTDIRKSSFDVTIGAAEPPGPTAEYGGEDLSLLRDEIGALETALGDSSYTTLDFVKYAGLKSKVAGITGDSADIIDAISVIDILLKYNTFADREMWLRQRSALSDALTSPAEP